ncbi:hypothetical protein SAMN05421720_10720 [Rhodospira trueperi]|uniref:Uncharacterized protein n=1 Tax=Rhodospira trueperi TaxID=69960 RepID=A0A1G7D3K6_9PROT|nr:hypothetical protein SAMN05421720_10720 [Rhodospira trueperi]
MRIMRIVVFVTEGFTLTVALFVLVLWSILGHAILD